MHCGRSTRPGIRAGHDAPEEGVLEAAEADAPTRMTAVPSTFRFFSSNRRKREDCRFVAGQGRYVADISKAACNRGPRRRSGRKDRVDRYPAALAMPGFNALTGDEPPAPRISWRESSRHAA
jgi:hypothetical protein